jgi:plastocyanin
MKTKLLTILFFLTVFFGFSQTETITIPWNFFSVPASNENSVFDTDITIEEGDTVEWVWEGYGHNVKSVPRGTFGTPGDDYVTYDSPYTYSFTFMDIGSFDFECNPHSTLMYGTITVVPEGTLSINDVKKNGFSIYPNPSKSKLNINFAQNSNAAKVEAYDILGKRIYAKILTDIRTSINVSNWKPGIYLIKVNDDSGTQTKRFVKQ